MKAGAASCHCPPAVPSVSASDKLVPGAAGPWAVSAAAAQVAPETPPFLPAQPRGHSPVTSHQQLLAVGHQWVTALLPTLSSQLQEVLLTLP